MSSPSLRFRTALLALVALAAPTHWGCGSGEAPATPPAGQRPNVVLVTIDTLRADHVGAYGRSRAETPTLDRLAREGVLLEDSVVQVPQTRPSHASILTGLQPWEHGLRDNFSPPLAPSHATLATLLAARGYATAAFIGAYPVSRDSGLDRGFEVFGDPFTEASGGGLSLENSERPAEAVVDAALGWLAGLERRPFFLWVHVFDPHAPYAPPSPWRERFADEPYDGEIAYTDAQLGRLLEWLDSEGETARTLFVATSDHGEGLGEHGEDEHQIFVYDSTLRVPTLLAWPGGLPAGARIGGQFRSIDLVPTLLELAGAPAAATSGESRARELRAGEGLPENESYAESLFGQLHLGWAPLRALRADGWKYIDAPRAELYDLREDPRETRNLLDARPRRAAGMRSALRRLDSGDAVAPQAPVDPEAAERLAALGYVGGTFHTGPASGIDPKDAAPRYQALQHETTRGLRLLEEGRLEEGVRVLQPLTAPQQGPGGQEARIRSFAVVFHLGRALVELGRFAEAIEPLRAAVDLSPQTPTLYLLLAHAQAGAGRLDAASATAARGLEVAPGHAGLLRFEGRLLVSRGEPEKALARLREASRHAPEDPLVRVDLADLLRGLGRLEPALAEAEAAVRLGPELPEAHVALGVSLGTLNRTADAERSFRRALELAPGQPDARFFLAMAAMQSGRFEEAAGRLERLLESAPDYPRARELLAEARRRAGSS